MTCFFARPFFTTAATTIMRGEEEEGKNEAKSFLKSFSIVQDTHNSKGAMPSSSSCDDGVIYERRREEYAALNRLAGFSRER